MNTGDSKDGPIESPLDSLFDQIADVLQYIKTNVDKKGIDEGTVNPEILEKLALLESKVENFTKVGEDIVALSGFTEKELKIDPAVAHPQAKYLLEKGVKLKQEVEVMRDELKEWESSSPKAPEDKKLDKTGKEKRKKLKRNSGGDSNWKRL